MRPSASNDIYDVLLGSAYLKHIVQVGLGGNIIVYCKVNFEKYLLKIDADRSAPEPEVTLYLNFLI